MAKKKVDFMITAFRDGFQSVYGARVFTKDFIPAVEAASAAGLKHFEAGGGARFQSLYFYSNEDAFDMMDQFRAAAGPDANLQTLARGVNVVGLSSQSRDIIKLHAKLFKKHGITTIRNFDALNDVNNLIDSGKAIVDAGAKHEVCVTMMALPEGVTGAHDPDFYEMTLRGILDAGIPYDSVCFKDASGTSTPSVVHESIKRARKMLPEGTRIVFHSHETAGVSIIQYKAALDAGANQVDLSMSPASGGTCQPDVMTMYHALRGSEYDMGIDPAKVYEAEEVFKECMKDYFMPPEAKKVEPLIPLSPMPGGALTANTQMLRDNDLLDRYEEITKNMGEVVIKGGYGTSVTPVSQFYFQQAFNNTMFGPWKKIADGYGKMVLGYFGKTPCAPDPEIVKLASEQLGKPVFTDDPLDILEPGIPKATKILEENKLPVNDENIFIIASCEQKGLDFLQGNAVTNVRKITDEPPVDKKASAQKAAAPATAASIGPRDYTITVNNRPYNVTVSEAGGIQAAPAAAAAPVPAAAPAVEGTEVEAPTPGNIVKILVDVGASVTVDQPLVVMEAMKMESEVKSPCAGKVLAIHIATGDTVQTSDPLFTIG